MAGSAARTMGLGVFVLALLVGRASPPALAEPPSATSSSVLAGLEGTVEGPSTEEPGRDGLGTAVAAALPRPLPSSTLESPGAAEEEPRTGEAQPSDDESRTTGALSPVRPDAEGSSEDTARPFSGDDPTPARAPAADLAEAVKGALKARLEARSESGPSGPIAGSRRNEREAIGAFYMARDFAPLWFVEGKPGLAAKAVVPRLERAGEDGLDLSGFPVPSLDAANAEDLAAADVALTDAVVAYGRQATGSRVDPATISRLIAARPEVADAAVILTLVAAAGTEAGEKLRGFNPPHAPYAALRERLARLRGRHAPASAREPKIPQGPVLRVGMHDPRVPLVRARLSLEDRRQAEAVADSLYDARVAAAVAEFQKANGLPRSGALTPQTVALLSGARPSRLEAEILANMERWRWMPRDLGENRIEVNIPDFEAAIIAGGTVVDRHRVVVGKEETPTPIFSEEMQYLIVNPYWNVPPSIIRNEYSSDPRRMRRLGYEVFSRNGQLVVRQPPGERNALGRIKFMFPNPFSVYMHDTPSRALFGESRRAYSHGCVRVDEPFRFAEAVLGKGWSETRLRKLIGGKERYIHLPKPLPVHIEYFTTYVDGSGQLQTRDDIYGYSRRVRLALGLDG